MTVANRANEYLERGPQALAEPLSIPLAQLVAQVREAQRVLAFQVLLLDPQQLGLLLLRIPTCLAQPEDRSLRVWQPRRRRTPLSRPVVRAPLTRASPRPHPEFRRATLPPCHSPY